MNKSAKIGALVLLAGIVVYLFIGNSFSGINRALIIGLLIGIGFVLGGQLQKITKK